MLNIHFVPTPEGIAMVAGAALAIIFEYFPFISAWFETLTESNKKLVMAGAMIAVTGIAFGLSCVGIIGGLICTSAGLMDVIYALILAIVANQGVHQLTKKSAAVAEFEDEDGFPY